MGKRWVLRSCCLFIWILSVFTASVSAEVRVCAYDEAWIRGDADRNNRLNINDAIFVLRYLFQGGSPVSCLERGDVDNDKAIKITDAVYLLNYLFSGGPHPRGPLYWGDRLPSDYPIEIEFMYVNYPEDGIPEATIQASAPVTLSVHSKAGKIKDCKVEAIQENADGIIPIIDSGFGSKSSGHASEPFEFVIKNELEFGAPYFLKVICDDDKGNIASAQLKLTLVHTSPEQTDICQAERGDICCSKSDGVNLCILGNNGNPPKHGCNDAISIDPDLTGVWERADVSQCNTNTRTQQLAYNPRQKNDFVLLQALFPPPPVPGEVSEARACCEVTCDLPDGRKEKTCAQTTKDDCDSISDEWSQSDYFIHGNVKVLSPQDLCTKVFPGSIFSTLPVWKVGKLCDTYSEIPKCINPTQCEVKNMRILHVHDRDWNKIPRDFSVPKEYLYESEINDMNSKTSFLQLPRALDVNHHENELLELNEGWTYGTYTRPIRNTEVEYGGSYGVGYGFVVDAELSQNSKAEKCFEGQFTMATVNSDQSLIDASGNPILDGSGNPVVTNVRSSKYIGGRDSNGRPTASDLGKYMHPTSEIKEDKSIRQMERPIINEYITLQRDYNNFGEVDIKTGAPLSPSGPGGTPLPSFSLCWYGGNLWCYDGYIEVRSIIGRPRGVFFGLFTNNKYDIKDHITGIVSSWTSGTGFTSRVYYYPPHIVWYDNPGLPAISLEDNFFSPERPQITLPNGVIIPSSSASFRNIIFFSSFKDFKFSAIPIVEDEAPREYSEIIGDGTEIHGVALHRWMCEFSDLYFKNTENYPKRVELPMGNPICKCYPQRKKSENSKWERIKDSNGDYIEVTC